MESHGYPYRLSHEARNPNTRSNGACSTLKRSDFTPAVRQRIEQYYQADFKLFGYSYENAK
jgi:hypothetical protein